MDLDMGVFYRKLIKSDPDRKIYGHIPFMASCSYASIGALNAESFCERVLSAANLVVTDGNTVAALVGGGRDAQCDAQLRINRRFMELCRSKFAKEAKQQFNQTIVEEDEAAAAPSTSAGASPSNSAAAAGTSNAAVQEIFERCCSCVLVNVCLPFVYGATCAEVVFVNRGVRERVHERFVCDLIS